MSGFAHPFDHFFQCEVEPCVASECEDTFRSHPNRKPVCDFLRILLMDSLLNVCANNTAHPLFLLLEVNANTHNNQSFTVSW